MNRFILKKDGKDIKTNTLFLTFDFPKPPEKIKLGYYIVNVSPYIPNPLRCFQCQKFGHSKRWCKTNLPVGNVAAKATMAANAPLRQLAVLIVRATIRLHRSRALFGFRRKKSNALRQ